MKIVDFMVKILYSDGVVKNTWLQMLFNSKKTDSWFDTEVSILPVNMCFKIPRNYTYYKYGSVGSRVIDIVVRCDYTGKNCHFTY